MEFLCMHGFLPPDLSGGYAQVTPDGVIKTGFE